MGCSVSKPNHNIERSSDFKPNISPQKLSVDVDVEIEEIYAARSEKRKISLGMDVASKLIAKHKKSVSADPYFSESSENKTKYILQNITNDEIRLFSNLENQNITRKIDLDVHEHKFEFEFLEELNEDSQIDNEINDVLSELNNL